MEVEKDSRKPPKRAETAESKDPALIIKEAEEIIIYGLQQIREAEEM